MRKVVGPLVALAALTAAAAGCSTDIGEAGLPAVDTADLQSDITARLVQAGAQPQSVMCKDPLVGEVGHTARCDVVMSPTNSFEPIVTVTDVEGESIDYELVPALSKEQLERGVVRLMSSGRPPTPTVACQSGLVGQVGESTQCDVTTGAATMRRTAEVTSVDGLMLNFDLVPVMTKAEVEDSLLADLSRHLSKRPDLATCSGNLEGKPGNTVDCAVVAGPETADFIVTVTTVDGTKIDFSYAPRG